MNEQRSTNGRDDRIDHRLARRDDEEWPAHWSGDSQEREHLRRLSLTERERIERWPIG